MVRNRVLYALLFIAAVVFSMAYQSRVSAVLLVAVSLYPVIAFVLSVISLFTLNIGFGVGRAVHEKNEQFELPVYIKNNFLFPFAPAELHCMLPDADTGLFLKKQVFVSVYPLKKMRIFVPCKHRYRGSYPVQILKLSVYDPFKLIRVSRKLDVRMQLVILPRKIPLDSLGLVFGGDKGTVPEPVLNGDKEDFSHVREYAEGDMLQMIHWKLTAKQNELMIKQYDTNGDRRSVILCNFSGESATPSAIMRRSDAVIETAVAVALSASRARIKTIADVGTAVNGVCEISDTGSFERFYDMMAVLPPDPETIDFTQLVKKYAAVDSAAMFLITPVINEEILTAAEAAAMRIAGTVVLIYVNCTGKSVGDMLSDDRRYLFAEVNGDADKGLPEAADKILADYLGRR